MTKLHSLSTGATYTLSSDTTSTKFLLYFHGGGFVYGSKNDLPQALNQVFIDQGYTVLALDYLLTPNTPLEQVLETLYQTFDELKATVIKERPFSFCGRSAGGFAAISLTNHLLNSSATLPKELINFYGYYDLDFIHNQRALNKVPIPSTMIAGFDQTTPIWDDPLLQRYILYLYAIQEGKVADFYQVTQDNQADFAISQAALNQFPRTFSSASTTDDEVPFKYSKSLKRLIPDCTFMPVYDLEHDFLKFPEQAQVQAVFERLNDWLAD